MSRLFHFLIFILGLAVVCWIGARYVTSNPLALAVIALIGVVYLVGALELYRYRQATATLTQALNGLSEPVSDLGEWLEQLSPSLRNAVRLRIDGERVSLPGPSLTPYLVGLLVLLGMLGTFLGMVVTLRGTGLALESATDLHAIRASLAAPVKGLGFAFGTSVAGVATSAMLGLLSALCRRERLDAAQRLDTEVSTTLRTYSLAHHREERLRLMQRQADAMPVVVDQLQAMMKAMEQHNHALNERLAASQDAFHAKAEEAYTRLAASVEQTLKDGIAEGARAAGNAIQPIAEATMSSLARESATLHETVRQAVQQQLDGVAAHTESAATSVAGIWAAAAQEHQRTNAEFVNAMHRSFDEVAERFGQRSAGLVKSVSDRLDGVAGTLSQAWQEGLSKQERTGEKLAHDNQQALTAAVAALQQQTATWIDAMGQSHGELKTQLAQQDEQRLSAWAETLSSMAISLREQWEQSGAQTASRQQAICDALEQTARDISSETRANASATLAEINRLVDAAAEAPKAAAALQQSLVSQDSERLSAWTASLSEVAISLREQWEQSGAQTASRQQAICDALEQTARDISSETRANASATLAEINRLVDAAAEAPKAAAALQQSLVSQDSERLSVWTTSLSEVAISLREQWEQSGAQTASRQQAICDALEQTARDISSETRANASATLAEIATLLQTASEAPRMAADVITEVRQKLSDSLVRDNAMLEERSRLLETVGTLLDAVNHASSEQRSAVDALITTSTDMLDRVSIQFTDHVKDETGKLTDVAAQVTGSAVEVASLADAFGVVVQQFGQSTASLQEHLQRIEAALEKSVARSDEQLAYYVAQAREVIDLSMLSQKQIIEELQQLAGRQQAAGAGAA